ncbi:MAG: hypothetical protein BWY46_01567 [Firmicutes bacterium ADurb.Bin300]|nr:MAG: hypothetical protein BWY46_01567 [Firmicutes bacterium ADurb.Bin300]
MVQMKKESFKIIAVCIILSLLAVTLSFYSFADVKISDIFPNIVKAGDGGTDFIRLQNKQVRFYRLSWLRDLIVKEDIMSVEGIAKHSTLVPLSDYPYTYTADTFKKEVNAYVKLFTVDEDSQRAAYLFFFRQLDALNIMSEPNTTDQAKIDYLRKEGILIPDNIEPDSNQMLMVGALYAYMKNDLYYVLTGNPESDVVIPKGTPLEEALLIYTTKITGQQNTVLQFAKKYFNVSSFKSLDEYIYYTSLYALWTKGLVSTQELSTITEKEVYRRIALMEIRSYKISIGDDASDEDIKMAYLAAGLGEQYKVTIDYKIIKPIVSQNKMPFHILQLMAIQDKGLNISELKYTYEKAFELVTINTERFDLKNDFYADIYEYYIKLDYKRTQLFLRSIPVTPDDVANKTLVKIFLEDGTELLPNGYSTIKLSGKPKETINLFVRYLSNGNLISTTVYKLNFEQGSSKAPNTPGLSDIIDITTTYPTYPNNPTTTTTLPSFSGSGIVTSNGVVVEIASEILNQLYSTDANGNYIDADGKIITSFNYETLPDGYEYIEYPDGSIGIVPVAATMSSTQPSDGSIIVSADGESVFEKITQLTDKWDIVIIIIACAAVIGLSLTLFVVVRKRKKTINDTLTEDTQDKAKSEPDDDLLNDDTQ